MRNDSPGAESVVPNEFPLFASSWVALYVILRQNFSKQGTASPATASATPNTSTGRQPH